DVDSWNLPGTLVVLTVPAPGVSLLGIGGPPELVASCRLHQLFPQVPAVPAAHRHIPAGVPATSPEEEVTRRSRTHGIATRKPLCTRTNPAEAHTSSRYDRGNRIR